MTRFPTYPTDILSRADALLSSKYPDGIVDPRFVEVACEAMMAERERHAGTVGWLYRHASWPTNRFTLHAERPATEAFYSGKSEVRECIVGVTIYPAKAIRGTE